ncbi:MAG: radical SAM protein [Planctomycetes bacterium]|jgi:threonylcarbamoyladenosine tRNA methylthiotransferase MtaB|nr:radical SAM protein [Planctomycetota bacterium]
MSSPNFSLVTLGCKVNQYDGAAIAQALKNRGLTRVSAASSTDLIILNSCCVTAAAMAKSRNIIRRMMRKSPKAAVLFTGCLADYDPKAAETLLQDAGAPAHRRAVAGNHGDPLGEALRLAGLDAPVSPPPVAADAPLKQRRSACALRSPAKANLPSPDSFDNKARAFVKIQDGCDAFCSYCIVPYARPNVWSRPIDEIVAECARLVDAGHRELVLCGIFLGAFGRSTCIRRRWDDSPSQLPALLRRLGGIEGLWRVRLSSIEPLDLDDALLDALGEMRCISPHFHMPLQSGSERILRSMNRQYSPRQYLDRVAMLRRTLDSPAITSDVIVGFPGETDDDFRQTLDVLEACGVCNIHAFPFSAIEPTAAWFRRDHAPSADVVRQRLERLENLRTRLAVAYRSRFIGVELEALGQYSSLGGDTNVAMTDRDFHVLYRGTPAGGRVIRVRPREQLDLRIFADVVE